MSIYKLFLRKILFLFQPETIHDGIVVLLKIPFLGNVLGLFSRSSNPELAQEILGLNFCNPVGLAAGFDKNAEVFAQMGNLGFGFVEIGTVTPKPQPGNPRPRLFRLPKDQALINRMGFNNQGVKAVAERLKKRSGKIIVAGNIGKNKTTSNEEAVKDYETCFKALFDYVDFFVVNVSSPNTPNLRQLQAKAPLKKILLHLQTLNKLRVRRKPILLKIAPDLSESQLDDIVQIVSETGIDGVIATNTTISREHLETSAKRLTEIGAGGLSGKPLQDRSTEIIRYLHRKSKGAFPIIGSGGIHSAQDALEKIRAGASLIELYTGFIYEGPVLIKKINKALLKGKVFPKI